MTNYVATFRPVKLPIEVNVHLIDCGGCLRFAKCKVPGKAPGNCCIRWMPAPERQAERDPLWESVRRAR